MKKLSEVKEIMKTEKVFETSTAFGVNDLGKYRPNITFIIPRDFEKNPLEYRSDSIVKSMVQNMNIDFDGSVSALFGDFWVSKKGGACFCPKSVETSQHVLLRVDWGGAFSRTRGSFGGNIGELYFRRAASNGGGSGYDYWVFPVGFYRVFSNDEIDGECQAASHNFAERAKIIRDQFVQYDREQAEKADAETKEKADAEAASKEAKNAGLGSLLEVINTRLKKLNRDSVELGELSFKWGWNEYLYTEENVSRVKERVSQLEAEFSEKELKLKKREEFQKKFEVFLPRVEELGLSFDFFDDQVRFSGDYTGYPYSDEGIIKFANALDCREGKAAEIRAKAQAEIYYQSQKAEAQALGLPNDIHVWCRRSGRTNAGDGWVIGSDGQDRDNTIWYNPRPRYTQEGDKIWEQILLGEVVLKWSKDNSAAKHEFEVVHLPPEGLTESQLEKILEIEEELELEWKDARGMASGKPSPSVGEGWGLVSKNAEQQKDQDKNIEIPEQPVDAPPTKDSLLALTNNFKS